MHRIKIEFHFFLYACCFAICSFGCNRPQAQSTPPKASDSVTVPTGSENQVGADTPTRSVTPSIASETDLTEVLPAKEQTNEFVQESIFDESSSLSAIVDVTINGVSVPVYSANPDRNAPFSAAGPWSYPVPLRLVRTDRPFFDKTSKNVAVAFEQAPEVAVQGALKEIKKKLVAEYSRRNSSNPEIKEEVITVQSMPLMGYEVTLDLFGKKIPLAKRDPTSSPVVFAGGKRVFVSEPIVDEKILDQLSNDKLEGVTVVFRSFFGMQKSMVASVTTRVAQEALARVSERINGAPKDFNLVTLNREGLVNAERFLRNEVRTVIQGARGDKQIISTLTALAEKGLQKFFANLQPMTEAEVKNATESFVIWTSEAARLELSPDEFRTLTTALETENSFENEWKRVWTKLEEAKRDSSDARSFYKKLHDLYTSKDKGGGSFLGIISASVDLDVSKDYETISQSQIAKVENLYQKLNTNSVDEGALKSVAKRKFAGEDYSKTWRAKPLNVNRITIQGFNSAVVSEAVDIRRVGTFYGSIDWEIPIDSAPIAWTRNLDDSIAQSEETFSTLKGKITAMQNGIDELDKMHTAILTNTEEYGRVIVDRVSASAEQLSADAALRTGNFSGQALANVKASSENAKKRFEDSFPKGKQLEDKQQRQALDYKKRRDELVNATTEILSSIEQSLVRLKEWKRLSSGVSAP